MKSHEDIEIAIQYNDEENVLLKFQEHLIKIFLEHQKNTLNSEEGV